MSENVKNIIKKDVKKYRQLAEYTTDRRNKKIYTYIANLLDKIIDKLGGENE